MKIGRALDRIVEWFGPNAIAGQVNVAQFRRYIDWRKRHVARPGTRSDRTVAPSTAADDCRWLATAINTIAEEKGQPFRVSVKGLPRAQRREFYLDDALYRRLLVTLRRGWIWDFASGDWLKEPVHDPATGKTTLRNVVDPRFASAGALAIARGRKVQRALIIGYYTGMRPGHIPELGWTSDPERGSIDLANKRVNQIGGKPRRQQRPSGRDRRPTKNWAPVPMAKQFQALARVWRDADARDGALYVIGRPGVPDAGYSGKTLLTLLKEGGERIGIARLDLVLHTMRHSCVTTLLSRNVPPFMVAGFVDDDVDTIMKWYAHLGLNKPYVGAEGDSVPIRNPLEALAMRDRGPMLAKQARLAKEAEEKAAAAAERARQARRDRRLAKPSEGTRRAAATEAPARSPSKRRG